MGPKARQRRINGIKQAISTIEKLAPLELKRQSIQRKHQMENAWSTISQHATYLGFSSDDLHLSTYYSPQQYLTKALFIRKKLEEEEEGCQQKKQKKR
jgi:hypothetical protein